MQNLVVSLVLFFACFASRSDAFVPHSHSRTSSSTTILQKVASTDYYNDRQFQADLEQQFIMGYDGVERYSMTPLPDSMMTTTVWVGNLCEFVQDGELSELFAAVSKLQSLPATVARKPNTQSLQYGFVAFPTVEEKEAAILRFDGIKWKGGKRLKVQPILDHPSSGRVRVPEKLVAYVSGADKTRRSSRATMRSSNKMSQGALRHSSNTANSEQQKQRESSSPSSKKRRNKQRHHHHHHNNCNRRRLNGPEQAELDRATKRGYLVVAGGRSSRHRHNNNNKSCCLLTQHYGTWCLDRGKPQIILTKAVGRGTAGAPISRDDQVVIDLSPLRLNDLFHNNQKAATKFQRQYQTEIMAAAEQAGMELVVAESGDDTNAENEDGSSSTGYISMSTVDDETGSVETTKEAESRTNQQPTMTLPPPAVAVTEDTSAMSNNVIVFCGERSKAKSMSSAIAKLWDIPEPRVEHDGDSSFVRRNKRSNKSYNDRHGQIAAGNELSKNKGGSGRRTKTRGLTEHRKRGGGHRQSWY